MAPILDDTLGGPSSNSYVDIAYADLYMANRPWADTWAEIGRAHV